MIGYKVAKTKSNTPCELCEYYDHCSPNFEARCNDAIGTNAYYIKSTSYQFKDNLITIGMMLVILGVIIGYGLSLLI